MSFHKEKNIKVGNIVEKSLNGLKSRLENDGILLIQNEEGYVEPNKFSFNPPASLSQIKRFKDETGLILPADYQSFLLLHNGARLFVHPYYGGGVELLSLEQMLEYRFDYLPDGCFIIAYLFDGCQVIIDTNRYQEGNKTSYLWYLDSCCPFDDALDLHMNFELWLDRLIIAQGCGYWHWPSSTGISYYKQR
jgi:hypothetical protein